MRYRKITFFILFFRKASLFLKDDFMFLCFQTPTPAAPLTYFYSAPFFTTWFCSLGTMLFLPLYLVFMLLTGSKTGKIKTALKESVHGFREKGLTIGKSRKKS